MSNSSLWGMDKDFYGEKLYNFNNSWVFSPIAWDVFLNKYLPLRSVKNGERLSYIFLCTFDRSIFMDLNESINNCNSVPDRIVWELSNQQIFFSKDKWLVANSIRKFVKDNTLVQKQVIERFEEIANSIESLDESNYPYFVFKNTSADDVVERWFLKYNEDTDIEEKSSIKDLHEFVSEFVVIEDEKIKDFIKNTDFVNTP
jgi:hypothetical protein